MPPTKVGIYPNGCCLPAHDLQPIVAIAVSA